MKVAKRRSAMLEAVHNDLTDVETLCERFNISEATVRRDLSALAALEHIEGGDTLLLDYHHGVGQASRPAPWAYQ